MIRSFAIAIVLLLPGVGTAACPSVAVNHRQVVVARNVVAHSNVIQTTFAVPIGVPVAVPSVVSYQAVPQPQYQSQHYQQPQHASTVTTKAECAACSCPNCPNCAAKGEVKAAVVESKSLLSLVQQNCVRCHSGAEPKGGLDLSGALDCETRMKCIARVLADSDDKRMPKGKSLNPDDLGKLIQELAY